ncbi:MAG TPA: Flp family type IVb pilin [Geminicoccaceae bacterium]|jgi:pilus assembly protein Flp/PilA|nr:Flp family type IVb pilin [Geminicoccaceae bacterium]
MEFIANFAKDESGATAIEYSLILGLVFLAITTAMSNLGDSVAGMFNYVSDNVDNSVAGSMGG